MKWLNGQGVLWIILVFQATSPPKSWLEQWEEEQHCNVVSANVTDGVKIRSSAIHSKFLNFFFTYDDNGYYILECLAKIN